MERINYRITLDAHKNGIQRTLQGFEIADNMSRRISVNLTASGDTYEIPFDHVTAVMYVTTPNAKEPSIEACTIEDNTVIYDMLPITEEGITEMQMKLIETRMDGSKSVLLSPKFAIEVSSSNADDGGATQTPTFTALEDALARAKSVYDARLLRIEIDDACVFRAYYADGTVYENYALHEALYNGNALLSESWAKGGTGIREGEETNNSMYFSNVSRSAAEDADMVYADARGLLNEAIRHTAFTSFLVDFENGNLEYMSSNSTFDVNEENGDLEFQLSNDYDPEKLVGDVVAEYVEEQSKEIEERLQNVDANTFKGHGISDFAMKGSILDTMEEINTNTQDNQLAGALAVKELWGNVNKIDGLQMLYTSILEKALTLEDGVHEFVLSGSAYSSNDLVSADYAYGNATVYVRSSISITVVLHGLNANGNPKPMAMNYYDGHKWGGWLVSATKDDLANYLPLSGGEVNWLMTKKGLLVGEDATLSEGFKVYECGSSAKEPYAKVATIKIINTYADSCVELKMVSRGRSYTLYFQFKDTHSYENITPNYFYSVGIPSYGNGMPHLHKVDATTFDVYVPLVSYDRVEISDVVITDYMKETMSITYCFEKVSSLPSSNLYAAKMLEFADISTISDLANYLPLTGGWLSDCLSIQKDANTDVYYRVKGGTEELYLYLSGGGQKGLYDANLANWIIVENKDGTVDIPHVTSISALKVGGNKALTSADFVVTGSASEATLTINLD